MRRRAGRPAMVALWLATAAWTDAAAAAGEHELAGVVDLRALGVDGSERGWLDGGLDKLRLGEHDAPLALGGGLAEYRGRLAPTLSAHATAAAYADLGAALDLTEAYLRYRPVPRSAYRLGARAGMFHPPLSLENGDPGWSSPYTLSFSAINTWLGEEVRTLGVEGELTRMGHFAGSAHDLALEAALFAANDPAGALLSWRGWALHDRQTRLGDRLPLADLPGFGPQGSFPPQEPFVAPFREIDGRIGYYAGLRWDHHDRLRLAYHRYDNLGDPFAVEGGQWAWRTRFHHLGARWRGPGGLDAVAQAVTGDTEMAGFAGTLVYAELRAAFVLLSRAWGRHRASLRYDDFAVHDEDLVPDDPNGEHGSALTAAYFFDLDAAPLGGRWRLGIEALAVHSSRDARRLFAGPAERRERSLQAAVQWRF